MVAAYSPHPVGAPTLIEPIPIDVDVPDGGVIVIVSSSFEAFLLYGNPPPAA
jgi:hypothetical protein